MSSNLVLENRAPKYFFLSPSVVVFDSVATVAVVMQ